MTGKGIRILICLLTSFLFGLGHWCHANHVNSYFTGSPTTSIDSLVSNLPILSIETSGQVIRDEPKINVSLGIINNGNGALNSITDPFTGYEGVVGIEFRGNSTQMFPKKSYAFETRDEAGNNLNVSLLGLPEENDWILRASYLDHTFIRNALANYMSRLTGRWASRTRHVEVVINGEYHGIYILMENIKRDKNRMDLATLLPTDNEGEELTGGYIWKVDGFSDEFGFNRNMVDPKPDEITSDQLNYITDVDNAFRNTMSATASTYGDPNNGYVQHINVASFIYELIVQEAVRNSDSYAWSAYFHKDKNQPIHAGPVWDFDQSLGNSNYPDNGVSSQWLFAHPSKSDVPPFWPKLYNDPFFKYSLKLRWDELRADTFSEAHLFSYIDSVALALGDAQEREFNQWPVLGANVWRETIGFEERDTYQKEVDYLKEFLAARLQWMDSQLSGVARPDGYPEISSSGLISFNTHISYPEDLLDLNLVFDYPYASRLTYRAWSGDEGVVKVTSTKKGFLKIEPVSFGSVDVLVEAKDTYGTTFQTPLEIQVTNDVLDAVRPGDELLYPNPTSDYFTIQADTPYHTVQILNQQGQLLREYPYPDHAEYPVTGLGSGVYPILIFGAEGGVFAGRLIIE